MSRSSCWTSTDDAGPRELSVLPVPERLYNVLSSQAAHKRKRRFVNDRTGDKELAMPRPHNISREVVENMLHNCKKCHGGSDSAMRESRSNLTGDNTREIKSVLLIIAAVMVAAFASSASAQTIELPPRVLAAAGEPSPTTSCAASSDLTGHMICAEIVNDLLYGVSWHTPPGGPAEVPPGEAPQGEVDELPPVPALGGSSVSCAPSLGQNGDPSGTVICAMASGSTLYGIAFSPEHQTSTKLVHLGSAPAPFSTAPSCSSESFIGNGAVICAIAAGRKLYGIQFDPRPAPDFLNSGLQEALPGQELAFGGAGPGCALLTIGGAAECAVTLAGGQLAAVAFDLNNIHNVINLGMPANAKEISKVSCAGGQGTNISCAVIDKPNVPGDSNLFIITADPQMTSPPFVSTGFKQIPGVSGGRDVSCQGSNDPQLPNDVSCAVKIETRVSSSSPVPPPPFLSVAGLKFNSSTLSTSGLHETVFFSHFNVTALNCISLFIDQNQISCGIATTAGLFGVDLTFAQGMD